MTEPHVEAVQIQGEDGEITTIFVETKQSAPLPERMTEFPGEEDDRESYGLTEDAIARVKDLHGTIRAYAWYAIGAFRNLGGAEVDEINLKFGLKIGGRTGVPILTEGSAEANFEISVKCKFPTDESPK
ncbi:MAG: CU044_2847 family protein [Cyanobacteria bacterium J06638_22]